jgi:hypothetical protein
LHARIAVLHRSTQRRHLDSAGVLGLFALRVSGQKRSIGGVRTSALLAGISGLLGTPSALVTLRGAGGTGALAFSDDRARAAHNLESAMAEGPTLEVARLGSLVVASGNTIGGRWPRYGPAVADLGVKVVIASPLGRPAARLGAMCALGGDPALIDTAISTLDDVTTALTEMLLDGAKRPARPGCPVRAVMPPFGVLPQQDALHQAISMVSVQCECTTDDATDLIAARAFAEDLTVTDVARQVVAGELRLDGRLQRLENRCRRQARVLRLFDIPGITRVL